MENLFAYGTLMCDDIMREVSGFPLSHVPGSLKGYSRRRVIGELYPAILAHAESCVGGIVYRDVPDAAWERLDRFEGPMYIRQRVQIEVNDGTRLYAQAYIVKPTFTDCLEASQWDFEEFLKHGKANFQKSYKGYHSL